MTDNEMEGAWRSERWRRKLLTKDRKRNRKCNPPRLVLLPAEPHADRLLHGDAGAGPVQDLVLHCNRQTGTSLNSWTQTGHDTRTAENGKVKAQSLPGGDI